MLNCKRWKLTGMTLGYNQESQVIRRANLEARGRHTQGWKTLQELNNYSNYFPHGFPILEKVRDPKGI